MEFEGRHLVEAARRRIGGGVGGRIEEWGWGNHAGLGEGGLRGLSRLKRGGIVSLRHCSCWLLEQPVWTLPLAAYHGLSVRLVRRLEPGREW